MKLSDRVLKLAIEIQQIPAPTFDEQLRSEFVRSLFEKENLNVSVDELSNVYARQPGKDGSARTLIVSAHLDTVFGSNVNLEVKYELGKVTAPGLGDNSLGVAALFGILWGLRDQNIELSHDLWLVANVGEEGLGDLRGMRNVVNRFDKDVIAYLVLEGLSFGHIYHQAIGVQRYRIGTQTVGGHSWSDYGQPSAIHELASLVTKLTSIELPRKPRTTMNVGTIHGGTGINVLASTASCELDLRSEDPAILEKVANQVEEIINDANREGVKMDVEVIGQRPAGLIPAEHPIVQLAIDCAQEMGQQVTLTSGSTDANVPLSRNIPAVVMGVTTGGSAHTTHEYIDIEPIEMGMKSILRFVEKAGK